MAKGKKAADNLVPNAERTPEELREMAKKGGVKSGETRRRKKAVKDLMREMLDMKVRTTKGMKKALNKIGYDVDAEGDPSIEFVMQIAIANQAMAGDIASARFLYDYALVPDMKAQLERERIKAARQSKKVDLNVSTAEDVNIMTEIRARMAGEAMDAMNGVPTGGGAE